MSRARVSFKTVGCRLNQAETAAMRGSFRAAGFEIVPFGSACDVCVIHGCAVTAAAERDSLRIARSARRLNPDAYIIVAGCVAEIGGEKLGAKCGADLAVGQSRKLDLPEIIRDRGICPSDDNEKRRRRPDAGERADILPEFETTRAIVKIQDGCDFFCSYCIVPHARGRSRSRPLGDVVREIAALGDAGFREVVLTGANIGCYSDNGNGLMDLLERVELLPAIDRIRISSIEISTIERDVIAFMSGSRKLCRYLHLPLQSGDDGVLKAMGRRYDSRQYRSLVEYAAGRLGRVGLGADVLVGFPGENERAFSATEALVNDLPFSRLHVFRYSQRPGTRSADARDDVPAAVKNRRAAGLTRLGARKQADFGNSWVGGRTSVLIESLDHKNRGIGWTGEYVKAVVSGPRIRVNDIVDFVPLSAQNGVLIGRAADDCPFH